MKTLVVALLALSLFACTKKEDTGSVRITLPKMTSSSKVSDAVVAQAVSAMGESGNSWNTALNPSAVTDINCFAVFVGGADLTSNSCAVGLSAANSSTIKFGPNVGFVPAGGEISLDVTVGARVIYLAGLKTDSTAACVSFKTKEPDSTHLSEPFLIASQAFVVSAGTNNVEVKAALDTNKKILDCKIDGAKNNGGDSAPKFGDGRDGGWQANSQTTAYSILAGSATMNTYATRTGSGSLPNTKIFAASRRITSMAVGGDLNGRLITTGSSFTSNEFAAGDEVAWYVAGGRSSQGSPDDPINGACGGGFFIGSYGTARVDSVPSSTQLLLDRRISKGDNAVRLANLSASPLTGDHCSIVLTRVSSFDNITLASGQNLTVMGQEFSYSGGTGGFLMVRADSIAVGTGSTLTFASMGRGFSGGAGGGTWYQGDGIAGAGLATIAPNSNGGAPGNTSTLGGSGGGNGGNGSVGAGTGGAAGAAIANCSGVTGGPYCLPLLHSKVFMGGGGGAIGSAVGGAGGGIVIVYAKTITGAGTINISTTGANGNSGSAGSGAGAGGSIGFFNKSTGLATVNLQANGGAGGTGTFSGGGGGGGVIHVIRCLSSFSGTFLTEAAIGTGGAGATAGIVSLDNTGACSAQ